MNHISLYAQRIGVNGEYHSDWFLDEIRFKEFSDNTLQLNVDYLIDATQGVSSDFTIECKTLNVNLVIMLAQVKSWFDLYKPDCKVELRFNYLPYARYDRAMFDGDINSLKVFGNLVNSMGFDKVYLCDPHSDVAEAVFDKAVVSTTQLDALLNTVDTSKLLCYDGFVSPDGGAIKKATKCSEHLNIPLVYASKKRDVKTGYTIVGNIDSNGVDLVGSSLLIVDDICDGGRTFSNLAEKLKNDEGVEKVDLFVTHGLFSKGKVLPFVDNVYCYNDFSGE